MKIRVSAVVVDAFTYTGTPVHTQVNLKVSAVDDDNTAHRIISADYDPEFSAAISIDQFNDALIEAVIGYVANSTVGLANGWSVDRNNVIVSGLFRGA